MTENANLKRRIRDRAAKTGESYTTARRQIVKPQSAAGRPLVVAAAQTILLPDPRSRDQLRKSGQSIRTLMREAKDAGAGLVHFPEGAITSPDKWTLSSAGPDVVAEADWSQVDRAALESELAGIARVAGELKLWTVVGGIAFAGTDPRPTSALFVVSPNGAVVGRYDERMLSKTKAEYLYRAGREAFVFEAGGVRFGCALGMETQYPEIFAAYERSDVDCVLLSTAGNPQHPAVFAVEAVGHAASNSYWVSYAGPAGDDQPPSGVVSPNGEWVARCDPGGASITVAEIDTSAGAHARTWRRTARENMALPRD